MPGRPDLDSVVVDPEIDRFVGGTDHHKGVEPGEPVLGPPRSADRGFAEDSGEGRFRDHRGPGGAWDQGPSEQSRDEDQGVPGVEGMDGRIGEFAEEPHPEAAATEVAEGDALVEATDVDCPCGEVHEEDLPGMA